MLENVMAKKFMQFHELFLMYFNNQRAYCSDQMIGITAGRLGPAGLISVYV